MRLSALIDLVEDGHDQVITRHGEPIAVVVPYAAWRQWQDGRASEATTLYEALRAVPTGGLPALPARDPADRPLPDLRADPTP